MIETLRIRDLAIVDRVEIDFEPGLNVLTGETGAGKSIVLGALALLAGARASAETIRAGAREARVEAVFGTRALPALEDTLRDRELEPENHALVVARSVAAGGRSRAEIAGRLVPVGTLAELFGGRLEVSSQHDSQWLRRPESHGLLLDQFAGLLPAREEMARLYARWARVGEELATRVAQAEEHRRREDFLAFQIGEIDEAKLLPGELSSLELERRRLAHAEELRREAAQAAAALAGDPAMSEAIGAVDRVAQTERAVAELARLDPRLEPARERLAAASAELADVAVELERTAEGIEVDPERLGEIDARLQALDRLRRKYGSTEDEILALRDRLARELAAIRGGEERRSELEGELQRVGSELGEKAAVLSGRRARAAEQLATRLQQELEALGMGRTRIAVSLRPLAPPDGAPAGPTGLEQAELGLATGPGEPVRALRRVASGGELSRVFLALKNALRQAETGMVLVFDEVDTGIGGRAAERVGAALAELARDHQVLCITHLPQIAARAHRHLQVRKRERGGRSIVEVVPLGGAERVEEIARMAGGARITDATRAHARELLRASGPAPSRRGARRGNPRT